MLIGGIEAGGTKMVCAIGETDGSLEAEVKIVDRISVCLLYTSDAADD